MLGRHPSLLALPETCLLARETMDDYLRDTSGNIFIDGLLRAAAHVMFGGESEASIADAQRWLAGQAGSSTLEVFDLLRQGAAPRRIVEKSPILTSDIGHLRRIERFFSGRVRYLHLVRHPRAYATSLLDTLVAIADHVAPSAATEALHQPESLFFGALERDTGIVDPQHCWLTRHTRVAGFLDTLEPERSLRVRGEDLVDTPRETLAAMLTWLELPCNASILDAMVRPEQWTFAAPPPPGVYGAGDRNFMAAPSLAGADRTRETLAGPLRWRHDYGEFSPDVRRLATSFGY